ncbi:hypothetical protein PVAG01_06861 [Phlyctema vagabunda]|uniref:SET domain-containing protein n=1 Tax=Phlyctema vagabunda TaxID=108571 RepID=A0ABR4PHE5_9HELO
MYFPVSSSVILVLWIIEEVAASSPLLRRLAKYPICPNHLSLLQYPTEIAQEPQCSIPPPILSPHSKSNNTISGVLPKEETPWTLPIHCLHSAPEYCIHTTSSIANGRTLSILTTTRVATSLTPVLSQVPDVYPPMGHTLYYEQVLPGRGIGLIANQTIEAGQLLLISTPVLIVNEEMFDLVAETERFGFQTRAAESLDPETQRLFFALAGHFGGDRVEDIVRTNAFAAKIEGQRHGIVVPEAARFNHACRPKNLPNSARYAFDSNTLTHKVHATRTIYVGEELTFSYIDEKQTQSARQSHLLSHWGFKCSCQHCSLPLEERLQSDARIQEINGLRDKLTSKTASAGSAVTPDMAVRLIELYKEEGLKNMAEAYMLAALCYCAWMNEGETKRYARQAVESWLVWEKEGMKNKEVLRGLESNARGSWCWGKK